MTLQGYAIIAAHRNDKLRKSKDVIREEQTPFLARPQNDKKVPFAILTEEVVSHIYRFIKSEGFLSLI